MSTTNTPNRNYVFPLKDEDLEASNALLLSSFNAIDSDVQTLFDEKADKANTDTSSEVDQKILDAINALDIYGVYSGDVYTDTNDHAILYLNAVMSNPGTYTKVTVNSKGLITFGEGINKSDIGDFNEQDFVLKTDIQDSVTATDKVWSSDKINTELQKYVLLTSYTDIDVLNKVKNVDGSGSGLDSDLLDGQQGTYYLDWGNFSNKPTTLSGYGITDAYTKTEVDSKTWDFATDITGKPTTLSGYGITDEVSINSNNQITPGSTVTLDLSISEVHNIILDRDITFSSLNLVDGLRGALIVEVSNNNVTFDISSGLNLDNITFDVTGLLSNDTLVTVSNLSSGVSSDLVGRTITISSDGGQNVYIRKVVSETSGELTLDSAIPSAVIDTGTGYVNPELVITNISLGVISDFIGKRVKITYDTVYFQNNEVVSVDTVNNKLILKDKIIVATNGNGVGEKFWNIDFGSEFKFDSTWNGVSGEELSVSKIDFIVNGTDILCVCQKDFK